MKNTIKILILSLSFACVSVLILTFLNSILKPPTHVKISNQFLQSFESEVLKYSKDYDRTFNSLDDKFFNFTETLKIYQSNEFLNEQEQSYMKDEFTMGYDANYASACLDHFHQRHWDVPLLRIMSQRIKQLEQLSPSSYNKNKDIKTVSNVLSNYDEVMALLNTKWTDLSSARNLKSEFNSYMNMPYLSNNASLSSSIDATMERQGREHYTHLKSRVEELGSYFDINRSDYDNLSSSINMKLKEYRDNAQIVYGEELGVQQLFQIAADYYSKAVAYYELTSPEIP